MCFILSVSQQRPAAVAYKKTNTTAGGFRAARQIKRETDAPIQKTSNLPISQESNKQTAYPAKAAMIVPAAEAVDRLYNYRSY